MLWRRAPGASASTHHRRTHYLKISARNQIPGTILAIHKGATTSHVIIDVNGAKIFASITNEAVDDLGLAVGGKAVAIIKASDVMVAVD